eukprot:15627-Pelagococcus_subviridis.AAC.4
MRSSPALRSIPCTGEDSPCSRAFVRNPSGADTGAKAYAKRQTSGWSSKASVKVERRRETAFTTRTRSYGDQCEENRTRLPAGVVAVPRSRDDPDLVPAAAAGEYQTLARTAVLPEPRGVHRARRRVRVRVLLALRVRNHPERDFVHEHEGAEIERLQGTSRSPRPAQNLRARAVVVQRRDVDRVPAHVRSANASHGRRAGARVPHLERVIPPAADQDVVTIRRVRETEHSVRVPAVFHRVHDRLLAVLAVPDVHHLRRAGGLPRRARRRAGRGVLPRAPPSQRRSELPRGFVVDADGAVVARSRERLAVAADVAREDLVAGLDDGRADRLAGRAVPVPQPA